MEERTMTINSILTKAGLYIPVIFTPFLIPFETLLALFMFSYLRIMPWQYKVIVLSIVFCFTILLPVLFFYLSRALYSSSKKMLSVRKKHALSSLPVIISYTFCFYTMKQMNIPRYMTAIVLVSLSIIVVSFCFNLKWRLSGRMASIGSIIGELISFSTLFGYNPVWWLCLFILVSGVLGTCGIIFRRHSMWEIPAGFAVGLTFSLLMLYPNPLNNFLFQIFF